MKKENYRAERQFTGKVGAGVALFDAGWLVWGTVFKEKHGAPPLGFSGAFMRDFMGETPQLSFSLCSLTPTNCLPWVIRKTTQLSIFNYAARQQQQQLFTWKSHITH